MWAQLFDFGILSGLTHALAEALGREDYDRAKNYVCTAFFLLLCIGILGMLIWVVAVLHIPWADFIQVESMQQADCLKKGIALVGAFFLTSLPFLLFSPVLHAMQKQYFIHAIYFISYLLNLLGLIVGIYYRCDLLGLLLLINLFAFIWYILCWIGITKKVAWARFSLQDVSYCGARRVGRSSIPLLLLQFINLLTSQFIPFVLGRVCTLKSVADFNVLWKVFFFLFLAMSMISSAYFPAIRQAFERGEKQWIRRILKQLALMLSAIALLGCSPLLICGNELVAFWIRMPLEQPLQSWEWIIYTLCVLVYILNFTLSGVLLILDRIALQIYLALLSSIFSIAAITWGIALVGLIAVFIGVGFSCFLSILFSFHLLKKILALETDLTQKRVAIK